MFCKDCGAENSSDARFCAQCGASLSSAPVPQPPPAAGTPPSNYLVQAILVTLFCCLPFGIAAIVFAARVNTLLAAGDFEGAQEASRNAKKWTWVSFLVGLGALVIYLALALVGAALS